MKLLRSAGYGVIYFAETETSTADAIILEMANSQGRILITRDKDFGELIYRMKMVHSGIILSRLEELKSVSRSQIVFDFIKNHEAELSGSFIVIQSGAARVRKLL